MPSQEYIDEQARKDKEKKNSGTIVAITFLLCFVAVAGYIILFGQ